MLEDVYCVAIDKFRQMTVNYPVFCNQSMAKGRSNNNIRVHFGVSQNVICSLIYWQCRSGIHGKCGYGMHGWILDNTYTQATFRPTSAQFQLNRSERPRRWMNDVLCTWLRISSWQMANLIPHSMLNQLHLSHGCIQYRTRASLPSQ